MKVTRKEIYIINCYDKQKREVKRAKAAFTTLVDAIGWCEKANEANEKVGLQDYFEYEWSTIHLYERTTED